MTSSKPKPLALAKSLVELNAKTALSIPISQLSIKPKCNTAIKLFKDAEKFRKEEDLERAYIYYTKYSALIYNIRKMSDYIQHKKFYDDLLGRNSIMMADQWAKTLSESLNIRYQMLHEESDYPNEINKQVGRKLKKPLMRNLSQPSSLKEKLCAQKCLNSCNGTTLSSAKYKQPKKKLSRSHSFPKLCYIHEQNEDMKTDIWADYLKNNNPDDENCSNEDINKTNVKTLRGLLNLGNTDFINCIIQCLNQTSYLANYFVTDIYKLHLNRISCNNGTVDLVEEFVILLKTLADEQQRKISPKQFIKSVRKLRPEFESYEFQDCAKFLDVLLDDLHEVLNEVKHKPTASFHLPITTEDVSDDEAAKQFSEAHNKFNKSYIASLFQGQYKSTFHCLSCKRNSIAFNVFWHLSLPIPTESDVCTLKECLNLFTQEKKVTMTKEWRCPKCNLLSEALKTKQIWKLPPVLVIHFERFIFDGNKRRKLQTKTDLPFKDFHFKDYVVGIKKPTANYSLYAVIDYNGGVENGCYLAYCKCSKNKRWYKIQDDNVREINPYDFKLSSTCMAFYSSMKTLDSRFQPVITPNHKRTFV